MKSLNFLDKIKVERLFGPMSKKINDFLGRLLNKKLFHSIKDPSNLEKFLLALLIFSLLFLAIPFFYIWPQADDFAIGELVNKLGVIEATKYLYMNTNGRYFSLFLLSFINSKSLIFYRLISFINLIGIVGMSYILFKSVYSKFIDKKGVLIFTLIFLLTFFGGLPEIVGAFYWVSGSFTHFFSNILFLAFIILFYSKTKILKTILMLFLCFAIGGSNETILLYLNAFLSINLLFKFYRKEKIERTLILLIIAALFALTANLLSPGTSGRMNHFPNSEKFFWSIWVTLKYSIKYFVTWIILKPSGWFYSLMIIWLGPLYLRKNKMVMLPAPSIFLLLIVLELIIGFFPAAWGMGLKPPTRNMNTIYLYLLFLWGLFLISSLQVALQRKILKDTETFKRPYLKWLILIVLFMTIENRFTRAVYDKVSGNIGLYNEQQIQRLSKIKSCSKNEICKLKPFSKKPKTIYFDDIRKNISDWRNGTMGRYYGKKLVLSE